MKTYFFFFINVNVMKRPAGPNFGPQDLVKLQAALRCRNMYTWGSTSFVQVC